MTDTKQITDFRISWTADHEQYFPGHGIANTDYTHSAVGVGETLREAFEDAMEQLCVDVHEDGLELIGWADEEQMLAELTSQVKDPAMLDWGIASPEAGYCKHEFDGENPGSFQISDHEENCAVHGGEWHYYVMIDVKVE